MRIKAIPFEEIKKKALQDPAVRQAYDEADRELALIEMLYDMRETAGLTKTELANRLGVKPPSINRLESNPLGASLKTLERYAAACGSKLVIKFS